MKTLYYVEKGKLKTGYKKLYTFCLNKVFIYATKKEQESKWYKV